MRDRAVNWQFAITVTIVSLAAAFVLWSLLRPLISRVGKGCGSGCGKCAAPEPAPAPGRIGLPQLPSKM